MCWYVCVLYVSSFRFDFVIHTNRCCQVSWRIGCIWYLSMLFENLIIHHDFKWMVCTCAKVGLCIFDSFWEIQCWSMRNILLKTLYQHVNLWCVLMHETREDFECRVALGRSITVDSLQCHICCVIDQVCTVCYGCDACWWSYM